MTVSSDVEVCNLALDHIGKATITSLTENSVEARKCARHYPQARDAALAFSNWTFARRSRLLSEVASNDFEDVWDHAYDLPNDAVTVRRLCEVGMMPNWNSAPPEMYIESGVVFTNVPGARMFYTWCCADVARWTTLFTDAVALGLAARLAPNMTRRASDVDRLRDLYTRAISKAVEHDAAQEVTTYRYGDGYVDARSGGSLDRPTRSHDSSTYWG